jgi:TRAP-type C4-dicarboxylate transport system permease small subunit
MICNKDANFLDKFVTYMMYINCLAEIVIGIILSTLIPIEVFFRYVLNSSLFVTEELSRVLFVWFGLLGVTIALHEGSHIGFDLLKSKFTGWSARFTSIVTAVIIFIYAITIAYGSILILPNQMAQKFYTMPFPIFWAYLAVTIGMIILAIRTLYTLVCLVLNRKENVPSLVDMFEKKKEEEVTL